MDFIALFVASSTPRGNNIELDGHGEHPSDYRFSNWTPDCTIKSRNFSIYAYTIYTQPTTFDPLNMKYIWGRRGKPYGGPLFNNISRLEKSVHIK